MSKHARGLFLRTPSSVYYYDDCSGIYYPCTEGLEESLRFAQQVSADEFMGRQSLNRWDEFIIARHHAYGAFFDDPLDCGNDDEAHMDRIKTAVMSEGFSQLILVVTDKCNLKCKYCIFEDHYPFAKSTPQNKMDFGTAKSAIDYYFDSINQKISNKINQKCIISFYGGEPLINFGLIKEAVKYAKSSAPCQVSFQITTNGTLLTRDIIDFLMEEKFTICISIDGPANEHDRNRVFSDGRGSFENIMGNLEYIWEKCSGEFTPIFLVTYDIKTDFGQLKEFFQTRDEFKKAIYFFSRVKGAFSDYYQQFNEDDVAAAEQQFDAIIRSAEGHDPVSRFLGRTPFLQMMFRRIMMPLRNDGVAATSTCLPGHKICVHTDGTFEPCERVHGMKIGDIEQGLDFPKISNLVHQYNSMISLKCNRCPVRRLCSYCFSQFWNGNEFDVSSQKLCSSFIERRKKLMERMLEIFEEKPDLYQKWMGGEKENVQY